MALQVITIADSNGTPRNVVVSDSVPGPDNYINAFVPVTTGAEVDTGNPLPVTAVVTSLPTVTVASMPAVTIAALPSVTVASLPSVVVSSLPSVTVGAALPAGTNVIGKFGVQANSVDVTDSAPLPVKGRLVAVSNEFTRPADTAVYSIGDVVGNSTSAATALEIAGCARVVGGSGFIVGASFSADQKSIVPSIRVHVFRLAPTQSNDNAPHQARYADLAKRIGDFVLGPLVTPADTTNSTTARYSDSNLRLPFTCDSSTTSLFFVFETLTAFTPASGGKFTLQLLIDTN